VELGEGCALRRLGDTPSSPPGPDASDVVWSGGSVAAQAQVPVRVVTRRALRRWAVVAAGTAAICALPAVVAAWPVPPSALSASQLRSRIAASADVPYQGYSESSVDLNLPNLPDLGNVTSLLDGSTDQYAWYRSPSQWRADVLSTAGEDDTYQTSQGTFTWSYAGNLLTQILGTQPVRLPRAADLLPPALGRRLLGLSGRADKFSRLGSQRVAGLDAAGLRIVPGGRATTIGAVDIWSDPATGLPVEVELFARGASAPLLVTRFLDLSLAKPSLATVMPRLSPDIGYTSTQLPDVSRILNRFGPPLPAQLGGYDRVANPGGLADVAAYGIGFARFVVLPLPQRTGAAAMSAASSVGAAIKVSGGSAVLIQASLLTVVLASQPGGPVFLLTGAVLPSVLQRAASQLLDSL
jgi:hypothetical protein